MEFVESPEFTRELKRLSKKYRSLSDDLEALKKILRSPEMHTKMRTASKHWVCVHQGEEMNVYKLRLACRSLRSTDLRVVYVNLANQGRIDLIEIYYKGDKENEDRERIRAYIAGK